jgi:hypothetical protein
MTAASDIIAKAKRLIAERLIVESKVDDETARWRMSICMSCEHRNVLDNTCKLCGCFLDLKTRAEVNYSLKRMRSEITHCPDGRWNDQQLATFYKEN